MDATSTLWQLMDDGGWVMWALLALSVVTVATAVERGIFLRRVRFDADALLVKLEQALLRHRSVDRALAAAHGNASPVARFAAAALRSFERPPAQLERVMERRATREQRRLHRGLGLLATVATTAPLLGFLGTVTGMMAAFDVLADFALSSPGLVAEGIKEALTTTAAGLVVAVPAQLLHNLLLARVARIESDLEAVGSFLLQARDELA